jgi:hypothetical protein
MSHLAKYHYSIVREYEVLCDTMKSGIQYKVRNFLRKFTRTEYCIDSDS